MTRTTIQESSDATGFLLLKDYLFCSITLTMTFYIDQANPQKGCAIFKLLLATQPDDCVFRPGIAR